MNCYNDNCHSHEDNHTCAIAHLFSDRPCYERILPPETEQQEESEE